MTSALIARETPRFSFWHRLTLRRPARRPAGRAEEAATPRGDDPAVLRDLALLPPALRRDILGDP
jgi:hypothetical protein